MKKKPTKPPQQSDFESLVTSIVQIHQHAQEFSTKAVNIGLTLRNWLIGRQIEVYERDGADRAAYGSKLMNTLAARLQNQGWARCDRRELYRFRQFYLVYPNIVESLTPQSLMLPQLQPLMDLLPDAVNQLFVSRYAVEMPAKQDMEKFLKQIGKELTADLGKKEQA